MPESSAFTQGQQITHTALNNVRDDVLDPTDGHDHDGTDGRSVLRVTQNAVIERFDLGIDIGGTGGTDVRIDDSSSGSGTSATSPSRCRPTPGSSRISLPRRSTRWS